MPSNAEKLHYPWEQFDADVDKIAAAIKANGKRFTHVFGLPRGGLPLAVCLSHKLGLNMAIGDSYDFLTHEEFPENYIVVDDIADTGKQLAQFKERKCFIATLFYHPQSTVIPDIWIQEKANRWIVFPWEKERLE